VKGSRELSRATLYDRDHKELGNAELRPPFYTDVISIPNTSDVAVRFTDPAHAAGKPLEVALKPVAVESLAENIPGPYSLAFYGCFQPFTVLPTASGPTAAVFRGNKGNSDFSARFLRYFRNSVLGQTDLPAARLVVGTGDQVYVDAGYEAVKAVDRSHPLSAWTSHGRPLRTVPDEYTHHLDDMYRAFFSFKDMRDVFAATPQANAWDDHEIRDGWGSVRNDYIGEAVNPALAPYFKLARRAYIEHQVKIGPAAAAGDDPRQALTQEFKVGSLPGFILDLRSHRNAEAKTVMDRQQFAAFQTWLNNNAGRKVIIVSSMPLFLINNDIVEKAARGELSDDTADSWSSTANQEQREELLTMVVEARVKPIFVSGDYHKAALSELWQIDAQGNKTVFGYELLATGLYHEGLLTSKIGRVGFSKIEAQRSAKHYVAVETSHGQFRLEPYVRRSMVANNFGFVSVNGDDVDIRMIVADEAISDSQAQIYSLRARWGAPFNKEDDLEWHWWSSFLNLFLPESKEFINIPAPDSKLVALPSL
jgi:hypothetical protein